MNDSKYFCLLVAFVLLAPAAARPWGAPGHVVVAAIAEKRLTLEARQLVRELVGDEPLSDADIATWADALRDPRTKPWHYVNVPFAFGHYNPGRDCARGCAVDTIDRAVAELEGNGSALRRADALRWLVHVVADIHQPMHAGDGLDRGGNDLPVRLGRRRQPTNMHRLWDTDVVAPLLRHRSALEVALFLDQGISHKQVSAWTANLNSAAWAEESNREALAIYEEVDRRPGDASILVLPADYAAREQRRVEVALQRAGVRLAALFDQIARVRNGSAGQHP